MDNYMYKCKFTLLYISRCSSPLLLTREKDKESIIKGKRMNKQKLHHYGVEDAEQFGTDEAALINHLQFWINRNKTKNKNFYDGRYWTFGSAVELTKTFTYWTPSKITRILKSLVDQKVIITGSYNKWKADRTLWYAFIDEQIYLN